MKNVLHITKGAFGGLDNISKSIISVAKKEFNQKILYFCSEGSKIYKGFENKKVSTVKSQGEIIYADLWKHFSKMNETDIIHVHHTKSWILFSPLLFFSKKLIYSFHINFGAAVKKNFFEKLLISAIVSYATLFSRKLIFLTKGQKNNIKKYSLFKKSLERKSVVVNNFINKSNIIKAKKVTNYDVIFVGRYTKIKGFEDLISLAKNVKDVKFSLVGENSFKTKLPNVKNLGTIDNSKIFKEYDKHSIFILPSYTEAFPMTILEAMARGLVILVSDIPGMREIVKEGRNGYLFPPGDIEKMKEIILYLRNNPKEIERISKNNLKDIWKFTAEKQIPKYLKVYKDVLTNAKN